MSDSNDVDKQKRLVQSAMKKINDNAIHELKKRHDAMIQIKEEQKQLVKDAEEDFGFYVNPDDPSSIVSIVTGAVVSSKDPAYKYIISQGNAMSQEQVSEFLASDKAQNLIKKYGLDTQEMVEIDLDRLRGQFASTELQQYQPELSVPTPDYTPQELAELQIERIRNKPKPTVGSVAVERDNALRQIDRLKNGVLDDGFTGEAGLTTEEMGALRREFMDVKSFDRAFGAEVFESMGHSKEEAVRIAEFMKKDYNFQGDLLGLDEVESPFYKYKSLVRQNVKEGILDGEQYPEAGIEMTEIKSTDDLGLVTKDGDFMSWEEIDQALGIGDADVGLESAVSDVTELGAFMQEEVTQNVATQLERTGLIDTVAGTVGGAMEASAPYIALAGSIAETLGLAGVVISSGIMLQQVISHRIERVKQDAKDKEYNEDYYAQMDMKKKIREGKYETDAEKWKAWDIYFNPKFNNDAEIFIPDEGNPVAGYQLPTDVTGDEDIFDDRQDVISNIADKINDGIKNAFTRKRTREEMKQQLGLKDKDINNMGNLHITGHYVKTAELYEPLKKYTEVMNKQIDKINNRANLYRKWVENGNDPDGYTLGEVQNGVYKKMPKMSVGAILSTEGRTPMDKIRNWTNKYYRQSGSQEHGSHPVMSSLTMADPYMMTHYEQQSTNDTGYKDALNAEFIRYKINQKQGKKNLPDFGDIKSPAELETAHPPFWQRYYIKNERRFNSDDMNQVKESMKAYTERGGKPQWIYQKPVMSSRDRYRWDRAFEKHVGGIIVRDKKTGKVIPRSFNKDDYDVRRKQLRKDRAEQYKRRMEEREKMHRHRHGRDFRPVPSPEDKQDPDIDVKPDTPDKKIDDDLPKDKPRGRDFRPVAPDGADTKHPTGDINPPITETDKNSEVTFNETKEWSLGAGGVNYDPNLADHYSALASLTYDMPLLYPTFDSVPPEYNLDKYAVKQFIGRQDNGSPLGIAGFTYNSFGFCLYDEDESRIVVAVEGTDAPEITHNLEKFISDVLVDLNVGMQNVGLMNFHRGMYKMAIDIYNEVSDFIRQYYRQDIDTTIIFTGHSLGAGVSTILSYLIAQEVDKEQIRLYTFGSPRCMDYRSSQIMDNTVRHHYRVTLENDVITYMPPRIEGQKDGYSHCGMNIQYKSNGETEEVIGRDEQIIFRSQIGASIAIFLTMMAFVGSLKHSLELIGLGSAYTPEGSSMYVFLKNTYKNFTKLTPSMQSVAEFFSNNLGNLIRNQQLNPNSMLNIILRQREIITSNFIESFGLNELEFRTLVTDNMLRNATVEEFVSASSSYGIPETQTIDFYNTMTSTSVDIMELYNPSNPVSQRVYSTLLPNAHSVAFYVENLAVGKGGYDLVGKIKKVSFKPMDSHARSNYRKVIEKGLGFYHHIGTSIKPVDKLIDGYEHLFSDKKTYKKNTDGTFSSEGMLYYPTFHKGSVYMNSIPEKYIIGLYFYEENEFVGRGDIKSLIVF